MGVGHLSPDSGQGDSRPAAWIPAQGLAWCLWASGGMGSLCTDRTPQTSGGKHGSLVQGLGGAGGSYPGRQEAAALAPAFVNCPYAGRLFSAGCSLERAPAGETGRQQQQPCTGPQPEGSHVSGCRCSTGWPAHPPFLLRHLLLPQASQPQNRDKQLGHLVA